jgi:hypothetical protein
MIDLPARQGQLDGPAPARSRVQLTVRGAGGSVGTAAAAVEFEPVMNDVVAEFGGDFLL